MTGEAETRVLGPDKVFLNGLVREIEVGILPEEYGVLQRVRFSVWLDVTAPAHPASDDAPAVSYMDIVAAIDTLTEGRRTGLVETLAERLAAQLLAQNAVEATCIRIEKLDILGGGATVGVECMRAKGHTRSVA